MHRNLNRTITYGKENIDFSLQYSDRKTLDIAVHPDRQVIVTAPLDSDLEAVDQRVKDKVRWILKQREYFQKFEPITPPRQYVGGETHLYLGRQYRLKIHADPREFVRLKGRYLNIFTQYSDKPSIIKVLLNDWYLRHATPKFQERFLFCTQSHQLRDSQISGLEIRPLKKRWGSFTAKSKLILNLDLIRAPTICIDYVITHELCHAKYRNHSSQFYRFLESVMPDWQTRKNKLESLLS